MTHSSIASILVPGIPCVFFQSFIFSNSNFKSPKFSTESTVTKMDVSIRTDTESKLTNKL